MPKRKILTTCSFVFFLAMGNCSHVWANELEDLKKRIEELEKWRNRQPSMLAGYKDGQSTFVPSVVLQFQHRVEGIKESQDTHGFFLRRARLKFEGTLITKDLEYEAEFDFGTPDPGDEQFDLKDFYFDFRLLRPLRIKGGQYKTPFGFQELTSSKKQQFVDRSLASEEFVHGRDIGVMVWGPDEGKRFVYYLGAFNGDKDNNTNANTDLLYAAHLVFNPVGKYKEHESDLAGTASPRLSLGVEAFRNKDTTMDDNILVVGGYVGFKIKGASLRSEYFNRMNRDDGSSEADDLDAHGYYAQAGYFVFPKKVELAGRGARVSRDGNDNDEWEYSLALNYFFKGQKAKLQFDHTWLTDEDAIAGPRDETRHIFRSQLQIYF